MATNALSLSHIDAFYGDSHVLGDVSFELDPKGNEVLLTVIHRRLPDRATLLRVGSGWHMHLDVLVARTTGKEPEPFWDGWSRLRQEYDRRMPPD